MAELHGMPRAWCRCWMLSPRPATGPRTCWPARPAAAAVPLLTVVLAGRRGQLSLATSVLAFVVAVIAAAMAGGLVPAALPAGRGPWQPPARPRGA